MDESPAVVDAPSETVSPRHRPVVLAGVAVTVVVTDQLTKYWAVAALSGRPPIEIVHGALWLNLIRNSGAAFSLATGATWLFTVIAVAVSLAIVRIARRLGSTWWAAALGLMLGGAVGNLLDRLFRTPGFARGHVVDFIQLPHYPVFNVADSCIVVAAVLIGVLGLRGIGVDGSRHDD